MTVAETVLWGRTIGAIVWDADRAVANFEYEPAFVGSGIEVAPLMMPLSNTIYSFPALPRETFLGLPGMVADSLPDRFGSALIDAWLARQGRAPSDFDPVERLCYVGSRGMGALEYVPSIGPSPKQSRALDVGALVDLASEILTHRENFATSFASDERKEALQDILRVGTSAGGARAKAIIAWNPVTNAVRSGQVAAGEGFSYWLLKFDGVKGNKDKELDDPQGYGLIEYAYYTMATAAGIHMTECRLLRENSRNHFMAKRFDRHDDGRKIHMQSLGALAHLDFNRAGAHSYEQAFRVMQQLGLPMESVEQQFRRMAFNIVARNQDDHVKNIAFLMNKAGEWSLSPAFDVTYSYNPSGAWTATQQMSMNGKRDDFVADDFTACGRNIGLRRGHAAEIVGEVVDTVSRWDGFAQEAEVPAPTARRIRAAHRLKILSV